MSEQNGRTAVRRVSMVLLGAAIAVSASAQLEVRFHPAETVYAYIANGGRGVYDLVIHNVLAVNRGDAALTLTGATVEILRDGEVVRTVAVGVEDFARATGQMLGMREQGMGFLVDLQLPSSALGEEVALATPPRLEPGRAAVAQSVYVATRGLPSAVRVRVEAAPDGDGGKVVATGRLAVAEQLAANDYRLPLAGSWFMRSTPGPSSHHRWNSQTEFAVDFWKLDGDGRPHRGEGTSAEEYYGYGAPVLAAADGVVVAMENEAEQDWEVRLPREGEDRQAHGRRLMRYNVESMRAGLHRALMGNHVVIAHDGGEHSAYGHLKRGSVRVQVGQRVRQGEVIGEVGDTGDTHLVHLHFQISDGPDPLAARSVPFRFTDAKPFDELGRFVASEAAE